MRDGESRGALFVVATPIGNLEDIGARALRVLGEVELILAEDTRHTRRLLSHFGIATRVRACHEHNERALVEELVARIEAGARFALVSDAGTPLVSDPGFPLVVALRERGLPVLAVPGPSALAAAVSVAGLPVERFVFEGFLPARGAARRRRIEALRHEPRTIVLYEAPHRILDTLADLSLVLGENRRGVIARELTKLHETVETGSLTTLGARLAADPDSRRGEMVLLVEGAAPAAPDEAEADRVLRVLLEELPPRRAAAMAARLTGSRRNDLYRRALDLSRDGDSPPAPANHAEPGVASGTRGSGEG
jgi:16S rRNA (cytidine1402-2'-O)-methyltransferase